MNGSVGGWTHAPWLDLNLLHIDVTCTGLNHYTMELPSDEGYIQMIYVIWNLMLKILVWKVLKNQWLCRDLNSCTMAWLHYLHLVMACTGLIHYTMELSSDEGYIQMIYFLWSLILNIVPHFFRAKKKSLFLVLTRVSLFILVFFNPFKNVICQFF